MKNPYPDFFALLLVIFPACSLPALVSGQSSLAATAAAQALTLTPARHTDVINVGSFFVNSVGGFQPGSFPFPKSREKLPDVFAPSRPRSSYTCYPWRNDIVTTLFWVGEKATRNNPVPNTASSWDPKWSKNFGGFDDPDKENRSGWLPKNFIPKQNPFYIALPYNDTAKLKTKATARECVPWFEEAFYRDGKSVVKGRWIAIRRGDKVCYGQWEDCGPFETDDWEYVFEGKRPNTRGNGGAGLDVSPAIRDYLGFKWNALCDWRFVELHEIPDGPWKTWGNNNPFALRSRQGTGNFSESITRLREMREMMLNPQKQFPEEEPVANGRVEFIR
ncbi:MAG: hypothetical protein P1V20_03670 [Verrucomicrobiales bacterium]|nr:hypothetical protein [Verrucomicrobiales bacterium]